jgi:hypothetical protein
MCIRVSVTWSSPTTSFNAIKLRTSLPSSFHIFRNAASVADTSGCADGVTTISHTSFICCADPALQVSGSAHCQAQAFAVDHCCAHPAREQWNCAQAVIPCIHVHEQQHHDWQTSVLPCTPSTQHCAQNLALCFKHLVFLCLVSVVCGNCETSYLSQIDHVPGAFEPQSRCRHRQLRERTPRPQYQEARERELLLRAAESSVPREPVVSRRRPRARMPARHADPADSSVEPHAAGHVA